MRGGEMAAPIRDSHDAAFHPADIVLRNSGGRVTLDVLRAKGDIGVRLVTRL